MKLRVITNSWESFKEIRKRNLSGVLAYDLSIIYDKVETFFTGYEKGRLALVKKYGKINKNGSGMHVGADNWPKFSEALLAIEDKEIDVDYNRIPIKLFLEAIDEDVQIIDKGLPTEKTIKGRIKSEILTDLKWLFNDEIGQQKAANTNTSS